MHQANINKTCNVHVTWRSSQATVVIMEKQYILHILSVCF